MPNLFRNLKKKMKLSAQNAVKEKTLKLLAEMPLQELRQAKHLSQERLAEILATKQANVSRIE